MNHLNPGQKFPGHEGHDFGNVGQIVPGQNGPIKKGRENIVLKEN